MSQSEQGFRSDRVAFLQQSAIRAMTKECLKVGGVNLGQGLCPLPAPPKILKTTQAAVGADESTYSPFDGARELREAVAEKLARYNGLTYDPEGEILVTVGAAGAFICALQGLFNPGDEIIIFEPFYGYHLNGIGVSGCEAKVVRLKGPDWSFDMADLKAVLTKKTRAVLINTPSNPSGKVFDEAELKEIAQFCIEHDLLAITDEIYEYMVFDGRRHISIATLEGMRERTITISGFSKTFAITGWRLGYAAGPAEILEPMGLVNDLFYICAPTPLQIGVARGMKLLEESYYEEMRAQYEQNRDFFCEVLQEAGLMPHVPEGAYYILADVSRLGCVDSRSAAMKLLERTGVASVPGEAFFVAGGGDDLVRFCVAQPREVLEAAAKRLSNVQF